LPSIRTHFLQTREFTTTPLPAECKMVSVLIPAWANHLRQRRHVRPVTLLYTNQNSKSSNDRVIIKVRRTPYYNIVRQVFDTHSRTPLYTHARTLLTYTSVKNDYWSQWKYSLLDYASGLSCKDSLIYHAIRYTRALNLTYLITSLQEHCAMRTRTVRTQTDGIHYSCFVCTYKVT